MKLDLESILLGAFLIVKLTKQFDKLNTSIVRIRIFSLKLDCVCDLDDAKVAWELIDRQTIDSLELRNIRVPVLYSQYCTVGTIDSDGLFCQTIPRVTVKCSPSLCSIFGMGAGSSGSPFQEDSA